MLAICGGLTLKKISLKVIFRYAVWNEMWGIGKSLDCAECSMY